MSRFVGFNYIGVQNESTPGNLSPVISAIVILSTPRRIEGAIGTHGYYLVVPTGTPSGAPDNTIILGVRTSFDVTLIT